MNVQNSFTVTCRKIATIKQSMIEGKVIYVPPFWYQTTNKFTGPIVFFRFLSAT